jgi:predicted ATPase
LDDAWRKAILSTMGRGTNGIRTPDQRLRVFVSSTLKELEHERRVVRAVIERLALAPVMFEMGARPHPPRSLYRAYLEQSDIFVGIYWQSYGWVAPGEAISGLEDEYDLVQDIPMLIYVKNAEHRAERLDALLSRIREDDGVSYVSFDDAQQLDQLVTSDLATLLAERFDSHRGRGGDDDVEVRDRAGSSRFRRAPAPLTRLIGRDADLRYVVGPLSTGTARLVTVTGPGGIGKTRLALAAARVLEESFPDGVVFVDLAPLRDPSLVLPTIAGALGVRDLGDMPLPARLSRALSGRRLLLLLDNLEQVVDAAADLSGLLSDSSVSMLVTSRTLLHIEGEQNVPLAPLPPPDAVELLVERAHASSPDFELTDDNAADVGAIATALDNLPLALELAGAQLRVLTPAALVQRLDHALRVLTVGARDRPERQRALRATIDWSVQLLSDQERTLLLRLSMFRGSFALDAVEWMLEDPESTDALKLMTGLIDSSLLRASDVGSSTSFSMLQTVREYGRDELERGGHLLQCRQRHAEFYSNLARRAAPHLTGSEQRSWMTRLRAELQDIRATLTHYADTAQADASMDLLWSLYWFWWTIGRIREGVDWVRPVANDDAASARTRIRAQFLLVGFGTMEHPDASRIADLEGFQEFFIGDRDPLGEFLTRIAIGSLQLVDGSASLDAAQVELDRALKIASQIDSPFLTAMALQIAGQVPMGRGDIPGAISTFEASVRAARTCGDVLLESAGLYQLAWSQLLLRNYAEANTYFIEQLRISDAEEHDHGIANGLEGLFAVAAASGDLERAGELLGAAEHLRDREGLIGPGMLPYYQRALAEAEKSPAVEQFQRGRDHGRRANVRELVTSILTITEFERVRADG